ncbi:MAG: hypothetical protein HQM08_17960 [Candidatus Riflebacteria bacterium]|nr:hypothetical protein [Candidatus Riflebacteria bacterium]
MSTASQTVIAAAKLAFPESDTQTIVDLLDLYGTEPYEREKERVQMAIIALSQGDETKLLEFISVAKLDYRDVLLWSMSPPLSEREGERLQQAVRDMLKRWGRELPK